jgi:hypothetical protein
MILKSKLCRVCNAIKSLDQFEKHKQQKDGHTTRCMACRRIYMRAYKSRTGQGYYLRDWIAYFESELYGKNPQCEICDRSLDYTSRDGIGGNNSDIVNFDHSTGCESIIIPPKRWLNAHPCNDTNKLIWASCHFGILCLQCNKSLPSINRDEWLKRVIEYHERKTSITY